MGLKVARVFTNSIWVKHKYNYTRVSSQIKLKKIIKLNLNVFKKDNTICLLLVNASKDKVVCRLRDAMILLEFFLKFLSIYIESKIQYIYIWPPPKIKTSYFKLKANPRNFQK